MVLGHALPNAILPILAMIGIDIGTSWAAVVVESRLRMAWHRPAHLAGDPADRHPGDHGRDAARRCGIVLGNLLVDLVAPLVDPRIRLR